MKNRKEKPKKETFKDKYEGETLSDIYHYETIGDNLKDMFQSVGRSYAESNTIQKILNNLNERSDLK